MAISTSGASGVSVHLHAAVAHWRAGIKRRQRVGLDDCANNEKPRCRCVLAAPSDASLQSAVECITHPSNGCRQLSAY